jgi:hypothetical protein
MSRLRLSNRPFAIGGEKSQYFWPLLVVVIGTLICVWPLLVFGFPAGAWDVRFHVLYAEEVLQEIGQGVLFPRWLPGLNNGLGAPTFFYYGPVPYLLSSLTAVIAWSHDGLVLLALAGTLVMVASGLAFFAWARQVVPPWPAALGALTYGALPYHLLMDLWTRAAFAEFTAYLCLPLVFLAADGVARRKWWGMLLLPINFALLIATHIITALLTSGILAFYLLACRLAIAALWRISWAALLGILLSAVYLVPAVTLRSEVNVPVDVLPNGVFLGNSFTGGLGQGSRAIGLALDLIWLAQLALNLAMLAVFLRYRLSPRFGRIWSVLTVGMLVMMSVWMAPVWRLLPILQNVQFPSRMLALADLGTAISIAVLMGSIGARWTRIAIPMGVALSILFGASQAIPALQYGNFDAARTPWPIVRAIRTTYETFRPVHSLRRLPFDHEPDRPFSGTRLEVLEQLASAAVVSWTARDIVFQTMSPVPFTIDVAQLFFSGWVAKTGEQRLPVRPSPDLGLVQIDIPAGQHQVALKLEPVPAEVAGWYISGTAMLVWLVQAIFHFRSRARWPLAGGRSGTFRH